MDGRVWSPSPFWRSLQSIVRVFFSLLLLMNSEREKHEKEQQMVYEQTTKEIDELLNEIAVWLIND